MGDSAQSVRTDPAERDSEITDLRARLREADDTIRAISTGEVDAVVVRGPAGPRVYTLEGADHPYRVIVEQMHEGTVTLDRTHLILYSNPQFAGILGRPSDTITGVEFDNFIAEQDSILFKSLVEVALARGHSSGELRLKALDGTPVPVRLSVTPLETAGMRNFCVIASDLREHRRNEALLKEERLSRLILEQAGEAIVVIDPQGTIVRRSESAARLASGPTLMSPFDKVFRLTAGGVPFDTARLLSAALAGERISGLEAELMTPGKNRSALLVSSSPLLSDGNKLLGCVITLTDISERKRAEEALAKQAGELARSNSDLQQFAYSASHDLREPLRQLAVFSELLQAKYQSQLPEEAGLLIKHAVGSAHRMEHLLRDLLAYTKAAEAPEGNPGPTDANQALRKTLSIFDRDIAETGARVEWNSLPIVPLHEVHLMQLFQNLIGNALKYRSSEPPRICISATAIDDMWRFMVADNGIGVEPAYQQKIFGLFQRLHGGAKYSGRGIGLAICQKIVQRYGGRIWMESEPNRGSRFFFTLPTEKK